MIATCFLLALLILLNQTATSAEAPIPLGRAGNFAVLAGSTVTSSGETLIAGNLGVWPGTAIVGFPPGTNIGTMHSGNAAAADAQADLTIAYNDAASRSTAPIAVAGDIGGQTLTPGLYQSASSLEITSADLTLDAQGNSNAVFIFQIASTFTSATDRRVILAGGARAARIFWQVGSSATLGPGSVIRGNLLADQSITIQTGAILDGRALARVGAVTLDASVVRSPSGGPGPPPPGLIEVDVLTPIALDLQTGLLRQIIRLRNAGSNAVAAAYAILRDLPADVKVYNATGKNAHGKPFVKYNFPLAVGGSVELVIEYFRANRQIFRTRTFVPGAGAPSFLFVPVGQRQSVLRTGFAPGRRLIEFTAKPGSRYAVEYSDDGTIWKSAYPPITANANRVFWIDDGPPKTESRPPDYRLYRINKLP